MRPRIGLTTGYQHLAGRQWVCVLPAYVDAVTAAGGAPLALPSLADGAAAGELLAACHGLVVTGGGDLDPALWGEARHPRTRLLHPRRQRADLALIALAERRRLPVLGICLGCQEIAVARGGRLIQHVSDEPGVTLRHARSGSRRPMHTVIIEPGSLLAGVVGPEPLEVNSSHHQAVRDPGRGMRIVARSADGITEAIEPARPGRFLLAVQWHPESLRDRPRHLALFEALCRAARSRLP